MCSHDAAELLDEMWAALAPGYRVAAAVLDPEEGPARALRRMV
ncbi:hypothetical protein [Streptomyces albipurpureus]|nr:hypothetical protein [Streptomyces sp. CWNU-1]